MLIKNKYSLYINIFMVCGILTRFFLIYKDTLFVAKRKYRNPYLFSFNAKVEKWRQRFVEQHFTQLPLTLDTTTRTENTIGFVFSISN